MAGNQLQIFNDIQATNNSAITTDINNDGIVDGSEKTSYQIYTRNTPITISKSDLITYNDNSNANWRLTAVVSKADNSGYHLLIEGAGPLEYRYAQWATDNKGFLESDNFTWKSLARAIDLGWESTFNKDFNGDSKIGDQPITPPIAAPSTPDLSAASDSGSSPLDNHTSDATPSFTGTAEPARIVKFFADDSPLGNTTTDDSGSWSFTVPTSAALSDGSYAITAVSTDAAGNASTAAPLTITLQHCANLHIR